MRIIRLLFVAALAVVLIAVALANPGGVTLNLLPANLDKYVGGTWSITLPLFLVIFAAVLIGMLLGLIWEYLRESHLRTAARRRERDVNRLEREVDDLRTRHANPRDDVLEIMDRPKAAKAPATASRGSAAALPRPR